MTRPPWQERLSKVLAHHPLHPDFAADVYDIRGVKVCIGCATTYPLFAGAIAWLLLVGTSWPWPVTLPLGLGMSCLQSVSALGWTRWKWLKVVVKASLGIGLALAVHGVLAAPWPGQAKVLVLLGFLALARLSTMPRQARLERHAAGHRGNAHAPRKLPPVERAPNH